MGLEYWPCYHSYRKKCEKLSDQELGRLFRALMTFSETGEATDLAGRESIAFDFIADDIARAQEAYDAKCQTNRENGAKATERNRTVPNGTDRPRTVPKDKDKTKSKDETKSEERKDTTLTGGAEKTPLDAALDDFAEFRQKIRKPLTDKARALTLDELEKLAPGDEATQIAILNQSIQRGWQGVFPLKDEPGKGSGKAKIDRTHDDSERMMRMLGGET